MDILKNKGRPGQRPMYIAVFGDLHGKVLLPFLLAKEWQHQTGKKLNHLLCVGDLGVYRSFHAMEKTSQRFARKHPEELGFSKFFYHFDGAPQTIQRVDEVEEALDGVDADLYFVPGNHEEHGYLSFLRETYAAGADEPVAVDADWSGQSNDTGFDGYRRIHLLPEGPIVNMEGPPDDTWMPDYSVDLKAVNGLDEYTPKHAWSTGRGERPAVLITHTTYQGRLAQAGKPDWGSPRLVQLIRRSAPLYHLFGHFHAPFPEVEMLNDRGGVTRSIGLNQVAFEGEILGSGCFGVLAVAGPEEMTFEIVPDRIIKTVRRSIWERFL